MSPGLNAVENINSVLAKTPGTLHRGAMRFQRAPEQRHNSLFFLNNFALGSYWFLYFVLCFSNVFVAVLYIRVLTAFFNISILIF